MSSEGIVGQILDGKYNIERQLGKGGMGTVYLSTHIGTGRPVAVKVIAPEFMKRSEFVERFRREAKAAGKLRHPNVVDVTDFGFSKLENGEDVAYLVMEYLDGCTLGEVLDEETKLPVSFTIDIIEQVCSAVEEAHKQGIIHRDLKPDNIWLEPNLRGGYTVKVLDFGIAKLEETQLEQIAESAEIPYVSGSETKIGKEKQTIADEDRSETVADNKNSTIVSENKTMALVEESKTVIQPIESKSSDKVNSEDGTAIFPADQTQDFEDDNDQATKIITNEDREDKGTKLIAPKDQTEKPSLKSSSTTNLTRVGAVLGTPLYMSPEQCRGEKLTQRSDIYSLAVIAYQMLSGKLPFNGDYKKVMEGHKNEEPPPLKAKKVPRRLKGIVMQSLAKDSAERPADAESFASKVRANSEGIFALLRKSLIIYSENLPKILQLTFLTYLPLIILTFLFYLTTVLIEFDVIQTENKDLLGVFFALSNFFVSVVTAAFFVGMMTWVIAQYLAFPLRSISLRSAFREAKKKAKSLIFTVTLSTVLSFVGLILCVIPGFVMTSLFMLIAPSIMMEGVSGRAAFKRSIELTRRSIWTVFATAFLVYVIPAIAGFIMAAVIGVSTYSFVVTQKNDYMKEQINTMKKEGVKPDPESKNSMNKDGPNVTIKNNDVVINDDQENDTKTESEKQAEKELKENTKRFNSIVQLISQTIFLITIVLIASLTSVITAMLYFKTRQAGGESMHELLGKLDNADLPQSKWQQRVRERLIQSGKITGNTTDPSKS